MSIPVAILTYGCAAIYQSIISLIHSTRIPLNIYIVNNSGPSSKHASLLADIHKQFDLTVLHCPNLWVLSLNHPIIRAAFDSAPFFIVSDDDIIYPSINSGDWLRDFLHIMHLKQNIGKLSLSLRWSESEDIPPHYIPFPMAHQYLKDRAYLGSNIYEFIGDTTPALYRSRLFSPNTNFFSPRHQKLIKPSLKGGVSTRYSCISLSNTNKPDLYSPSYASRKAICFALTSAYLSKDNLARTPLPSKLFYLAVRPFFNFLWTCHLAISHTIFIISLMHDRRK
jgi:hypothetical protein